VIPERNQKSHSDSVEGEKLDDPESRRAGGVEHPCLRQVVSERDFICILQVKEDRVAENSMGTCLLE
jgi:hypothetical protein